MKKTFFIWIALLTFTGFINAQSSVGLKGGIGISEMRSPAIVSNGRLSPIYSLEGGIFFEHKITPFFSMRTGANYMKSGFQWKESAGIKVFGFEIPVGGSLETHVNNIEVPVLFQLNTNKRGPLNAYAAAGPSFAFATGAKLIGRANLLAELKVMDQDINLKNLNYRMTDVGLKGLAGLQYDFEQATLFGELSYRRGFSDLYKPEFINSKLRNHNFNFSVGTKIRL